MDRQSIIDYGQPLQATNAMTPVPVGKEVLIKISHCGVCHSDVHIHDGHFNLGGGKQLDVRAGRELPFTLGHEIAGEVVDVGSDVETITVGKNYVVFPWIGCGTCSECTDGEEIYCNKPRHLGISIDGGYATHVLVPDERYLLDYTGINSDIAGAYMCSGLTAFSALKKLKSRLNTGKVLLVGLGGVGMMGIEFAKVMFGEAPIVADIDPKKREEALLRGASAAFDPADKNSRKEILKSTGGVKGAVDFAGATGSTQFAQGVLRKGGKLVVAGLIGGEFSIPLPMFPLRVISIEGSFVGTLEEAKEMLDLVREHKVNPIPVELRNLTEANNALNDLRSGNVVGRIVLTP